MQCLQKVWSHLVLTGDKYSSRQMGHSAIERIKTTFWEQITPVTIFVSAVFPGICIIQYDSLACKGLHYKPCGLLVAPAE